MTNKNMSGIHAWQRNRVENSASLVKRAIDVLLSGRLKVSLTTIVLASKSVDPAGKGVSASTILRNREICQLNLTHSYTRTCADKVQLRHIAVSAYGKAFTIQLRKVFQCL